MNSVPTSKPRAETVKRILYVAFSLAVTAGVFSYLLTRVSFREVLQLIREADHRGIAMFLVCSLSMSVFRLWRYRVLLRLSGHAPAPLPLFLVVLVRNLFSDLLPARLGSLIYIYLVNTRLGVPFAAAAASFSLAFVFDLIALAPMILLAVLTAGSVGRLSPWGLTAGAVLLTVVTVAVLFALPRILGLCARAAAALPGRKAGRRLAEALDSMAGEIRLAQGGGTYFRVLLLSLLVRVGKYASLYFFLFALLSPLGYGLAQLPVSRVFLGTCAAELAASLPISGIAGFGVYEGTWAVVFQMLGFPGQIAKLTSISHHLFTQVYGYLLGAAALLVLLLPVFKAQPGATRSSTGRDSAPLFYAKLALAAVLVAGLLRLGYAVPPGHRAGKPQTADRPTAEESAALTRLSATFPGRILFDSNRSGTFGIYTMKPDGTDVRTIDDTRLEEMYPDPSPDGAWIVFARALGLGRSAPSEVWTCRCDGSDERRLAEDGTFPTFSADGRTVYFERGRKKVMAVPFAGGDAREIFPGPRKEFARYEIVKPRVSPDGKYVVFISDRKGAWNTWLAELDTGEARHVSSGCEGTWFADSRALAWVRQVNVRERTGIYRFDLAGGKQTELQDADAPRGHEYFPTVAGNDGFLLWGACRPGEHDHTASNYQIFVRTLPAGGAVRVTFDGFDDRWPKLLRPPATP